MPGQQTLSYWRQSPRVGLQHDWLNFVFCIFYPLNCFWNYLRINLIMLVVQGAWRICCTAVPASWHVLAGQCRGLDTLKFSQGKSGGQAKFFYDAVFLTKSCESVTRVLFNSWETSATDISRQFGPLIHFIGIRNLLRKLVLPQLKKAATRQGVLLNKCSKLHTLSL